MILKPRCKWCFILVIQYSSSNPSPLRPNNPSHLRRQTAFSQSVSLPHTRFREVETRARYGDEDAKQWRKWLVQIHVPYPDPKTCAISGNRQNWSLS
ncbi:MAG: hypothetical protein J3Q66DRAFT_323845 [Benniella sp.]|nr:MAG: hypothetical protein J3Q66DRAFT_323845 [Benniella sp.]